MIRFLQFFNLLGVVALVVLSVVQWQVDRSFNLQVSNLERSRLDLDARIAEKDKTLQSYKSDLDTFRQQLSESDSIVKDSETKLTTLTGQSKQTAAERDQLKSAVDKFAEAVTARDEQIRKGNDELKKLAVERNEAVAKCNELATKYNDVVKELNEARAKPGKK